ncbi:unnamed protein product [Cunninghamella blakesleeana]
MPIHYKLLCFIAFFITVLIFTHLFHNNNVNSFENLSALKSNHCNNIELQPDSCEFVKNTCHGFSSFYLQLYYCSPLWKSVNILILLSILLLLFGAISIVASDFFCPNLQTISEKLQLSESLAGVTVLAFGNGSPDLFGTFSALDNGSGSMAIGEIIGAAFFIVSVITGCMGIIRPFQAKRITFMRDASFLTGAVALLTWIVYHGKIYWYHGLALIGYYITYVVTVLLSSYNWSGDQDDIQKEIVSKFASVPFIDENTRLLSSNDGSPKPPRLVIPDNGFTYSVSEYEPHLGHIIRPTTPLSRPPLTIDTSLPQQYQNLPRTTSTNGSISTLRRFRRAMTPRVGIRTSLFSAIEFQSQLNSIRRASSTQQVMTPSLLAPTDLPQRKRQISMPPEIWQRSAAPSSSNNFFLNTNYHPHQSRPRSSTLTTPTGNQPTISVSSQGNTTTLVSGNGGLSVSHMRPTTPESTHSSTGVAEDYFAYLSSQQPHPLPSTSSQPPMQQLTINTQPPPIITTTINSDESSHLHNNHNNPTIPEIRLAPPNIEQFHTPLTSTVSPNYERLPIFPSHHQNNNSLNVMTHSPSMASTNTDYDCFVSACQSPELTPTHDQTLSIPNSPIYINKETQHHQHNDHLLPSSSSSISLSSSSTSKLPFHTVNNIHITTNLNEIASIYNHHPSSSNNNIHFNINLTNWYLNMEQITIILFPTLQEWSSKSWLSRLNSIIAMPLVFIFTITLPVAETEEIKVDEVEVMLPEDYEYPASAMVGGGGGGIGSGPTSASIYHHPYHPSLYHQQQQPSSYGGVTVTGPSPLSHFDKLYPDIPSSQQQQHPYHQPRIHTTTIPKSTSFLTVPASESDYLLGNQQHQQHPTSPSPRSRQPTSTSDMSEMVEQALEHGWCKWLLAIQSIFGIAFIFSIMILNEFLVPGQLFIGIGIGIILCITVIRKTKSDEPPQWFWMISFAGFAIALNWIFLLANCMVGLLQALGKIFNISEAIMGLTIFAFGNSVGDLVSNTAIAKMGFPTMAISACYAGPLLNMVLGVGVSSTYQIWKSSGQPYPIYIPHTILISAGGLLTVLLSTLFVVNMNGFRVNKNLGYWTISVYCFCCIINLLLEFGVFKS